jgi:hypothetical protein
MKTHVAPADGTRTRRIDPRLQRILDHVWGPTGSALLHALAILLLLQVAMRSPPLPDRPIEAEIVELPPADFDDFDHSLPDHPPGDIDVFIEPTVAMPSQDAPLSPNDLVDPPADLPEPFDTRSPLKFAGLTFGVTGDMRKRGIENAGGRAETEAHVVRALEWLKNRQLADGSWEGDGAARNPAAMTGMALLCFLAHGETPSASVRYGPTVDRGIRWLVARQRADGAFDDNVYANAIGAYAIAEAYFLTRIPSLRIAMESGLGRIVAGQQDTGAFTYGYAKNGRRDTSVAGWQVQALKAGVLAGADVPGLETALHRCADGLRANYQASTGRFLYAPAPGKDEGSEPTLACTGVGVLSLQLLGLADCREVEGGLRALEGHKPDYRAPAGTGRPLYAWYYITQAMFRAGHGAWSRWQGAFVKTMSAAQNGDGSWTPTGAEETAMGPVYGTTFSALSLMVYYRDGLGTFRPIPVGAPAARSVTQPDDVPVRVL